MVSCDEALELISAGVDGELTAEETRILEEHLDHCQACRALLEELRSIHEEMSGLNVPAPAGLAEGVMERVRAEKVVPMKPVRSARKRWRTWAASAAVFAVVLLGAGTLRHEAAPAANEATAAQGARIETTSGSTAPVPEPEMAAASRSGETAADVYTGSAPESAAPAEGAGRTDGGENGSAEDKKTGPALFSTVPDALGQAESAAMERLLEELEWEDYTWLSPEAAMTERDGEKLILTCDGLTEDGGSCAFRLERGDGTPVARYLVELDGGAVTEEPSGS